MKASYLEVLREVYFYGIIAKVSSEGTPLRNAAEHCVLPEPALLNNQSQICMHMRVSTWSKVPRQQKAQRKVGLPSTPFQTVAPDLDK